MKDLLESGKLQNDFILDYLTHLSFDTDFHPFFASPLHVQDHGKKGMTFMGSKIIALKKSKGGVPYRIEGNNLYVLKSLAYRKSQTVVSRDITARFNSCYPETHESLRSCGSEGFVNEYLIGLLIQRVFEKEGLPYALRFSRGFCDIKTNMGYILMDRVAGDLSDLGEDFLAVQDYDKEITIHTRRLTLISILMQCASGLKVLKDKLRFSHNDLKMANMFFDYRLPRPPQWDENIPFMNVLVKFADFDKSSAVYNTPKSFQNKGLFVHASNLMHSVIRRPKTVISDLKDYLTPPKKERSRPRNSTNSASKSHPVRESYTITGNPAYLSFDSRHNKVPYYKSFDWYVFMASMLMNDRYRNALKSDPLLWDTFVLPLFIGVSPSTGTELFPVESSISKKDISFEKAKVDFEALLSKYLRKKSPGDRPSVNTALGFLKNMELDCEGIEVSLKRLENIYNLEKDQPYMKDVASRARIYAQKALDRNTSTRPKVAFASDEIELQEMKHNNA